MIDRTQVILKEAKVAFHLAHWSDLEVGHVCYLYYRKGGDVSAPLRVVDPAQRRLMNLDKETFEVDARSPLELLVVAGAELFDAEFTITKPAPYEEASR